MLDGVVVDRQSAVVEVACQRVPMRQRVADGGGYIAAPRDTSKCGGEPGLHLLDRRPGFAPTHALAVIRWLADNARLDGVELTDPFESLAGDRRLPGADMDVVEVASDVRPAGGLGDVTAGIEPVEAVVAIGLQHALERHETLVH
jgi:hypothetical protein